MHIWYWEYEYPHFFNTDDEFIGFDIYTFADNVESGSSTHINDAGDPTLT